MPTAVVTGCNSGIGYALAKVLIKDGYKTFATSRTNGTKLKELEGLGAKTAVLDVGSKDSIDAFKREHVGEEGVHLLINNAGLGVIGVPMISRLEPHIWAVPFTAYYDPTLDESLQGISWATMEKAYRVNTLGPLFLTQALLPNIQAATSSSVPSRVAMITSRSGSIGDGPGGGHYSYRLSKAAMNMLGANMAADVKSKGVAVVIVHPGMVYTESISAQYPKSPQMVEPDFAAEKCLERIMEHGNLEESGKFWHRDGMELPW